MKPLAALDAHRDAIQRVVEQNHACNPRVFGSVLHGANNEGSDLDLLVDTTPDTTLLDIVRIQNRLQKLLGVSVDVLTPWALPVNFREWVLAEAKPI